MNEGKRGEYPKDWEVADYVHMATKATLSAAPFVGGPVAEVFGAVLQPALQGRKEKWLELLHEDMLEIEQKVEEMPNREEFITIAIQASQIALRTHQEEKLKLLRNAVRNTAKQLNPSGDLSSIFLNILEGLTPSHIEVLVKFDGKSYDYKPIESQVPDRKDDAEEDSEDDFYDQNPKPIYIQDKALKPRKLPSPTWNWFNQSEDMFTQVARKVGSKSDHELVRHLLKDLLSRGLLEEKVNEPFVYTKLSGETNSLRLSAFGLQFLRFIRD